MGGGCNGTAINNRNRHSNNHDGMAVIARTVRQPSAVRSVPHHAEYVSQVRGADADDNMDRGNVQMKKCYDLCDRCVWYLNGGCSEWRRKHELR